MRRALFVLLLLLSPLARADLAADTADLAGILRALHADRCRIGDWEPDYQSIVISDRPAAPYVDRKTKRPGRVFDIDLVPRAPRGTLWPRIVICPTIEVVDHVRLERMLDVPDGMSNGSDGFELAFGGAGSYEVITLPAFSADGNRAVVMLTHECVLCGSSSYVELIRTPNGWRPGRSQLIWIS